MRLALIVGVTAGLAGRAGGALPAQDAATHAEVRQVVEELARTSDRHALDAQAREIRPRGSACTPMPAAPATAADLKYGFIVERIGELTRKTSDLNRALDCFSGFVTSQPGWPMAWLGLGLTRLALNRKGAIARPGPLQPLGAIYVEGAAAALIRALKLDPADPAAAVALPIAVAETYRVPVPLLAARDALRLTASTPAGQLPSVLLARAYYERDTGSRDSTPVLLQRFLAAGGDSTVGYLGLAREAFASGDTAAGRTYYAAGSQRAGRSSAGRAAYRENLAWVATPRELAAFDSLPAESVDSAVTVFWARRDAESGHADGARLAEHFRRYEYAAANFLVPVRYPPNVPQRELLTTAVQRGLPDTTAAAALDRLYGDSTGAGSLLPVQPLDASTAFDQRAAVYLRYGPPDNRFGSYWAYYRGAASMYLRVVPGNASLFGDLCDVDRTFCPTASFARRQRQAEALDAMWQRAHTTDEYLVRYRSPLRPVVQVYGLHAAPGVAGGRMLIVFAVRGDRLKPTRLDSTGTRVSYDLHVHVASMLRNSRVDHDTTRRFASPRPLKDDEYLSGQLELPARPGRQNLRVTLDQPGSGGSRAAGYSPEVVGERGTVLRFDGLTVPSPADDSLALSDIVPGRPGQGETWNSPTGPVPLNPLNLYAEGGDAPLYYEVSGLVPGTAYRTRVTFRREEVADDPRAVSIGFMETATTRAQAFRRSVSLAGLEPGSYVVTVSIAPVAGDRAVARETTINVAAVGRK
jgi:hypothetical protein